MYRTTRNNGQVYGTLKTLDQTFNQPRTQTQSTTGNSDEKVRDNVHNNNKITTGKTEPVEKYSSIQYNQTEKQLLQTFSSLTLSFQKISSLSPREIADKYDLPETSRLVECNPSGTTQIGWISKVNSNATSVDTDTTNRTAAPIIPPLIFQSWKTNHLSYKMCQHVLTWSRLNPEYDYFLFDDHSVDSFIQKEYGNDIFSAFSCVKQGAAKCDVWRLMTMFIFGGTYFDFDATSNSAFSKWEFGNRTVVSGRGCNNKRFKTGCGHQWGLIYAPFHPVMRSAIEETLGNLAKRTANHIYDVSFWAFNHAWVNGPYNSSYMPGWGDNMGGRVEFFVKEVKNEMISQNGHWPDANGNINAIWHSKCF